MFKLIRENVTLNCWEQVLAKFCYLAEENRKSFPMSAGNTYTRKDGLPQIPITNKEWASWVQFEHDERVLWFHPHIRMDMRTHLLTKVPFGHTTAFALVKAVVWNAALYINMMCQPIAPDSVRKALHQAMLDSNCPKEILEEALDNMTCLCFSVLDAISDKSGEINRISLKILKEELSDRLKKRTCSNRALRRKVCKWLIAQGIATLPTRTEQQKMLVDTLKSVPQLKGVALHAIERMLKQDRQILEYTDGISILLNYTPDEISNIRKAASTQKDVHSVYDRAEDIRKKIRNRIRLTHAERMFKTRHVELFNDVDKT